MPLLAQEASRNTFHSCDFTHQRRMKQINGTPADVALAKPAKTCASESAASLEFVSPCCSSCLNRFRISEISHEDPQQPQQQAELHFYASGKSVQHPLKAGGNIKSVNADAFLIDRQILGVADGVSSVEAEGYDPAQLPVELLTECSLAFRARLQCPAIFDAESENLYNTCNIRNFNPDHYPQHLLARANAACHSLGSTTCVLGILDSKRRRLWTVNVGDSQLLLLRRSRVPPPVYTMPVVQSNTSYTLNGKSEAWTGFPGSLASEEQNGAVTSDRMEGSPPEVSRNYDRKDDLASSNMGSRTRQTVDVVESIEETTFIAADVACDAGSEKSNDLPEYTKSSNLDAHPLLQDGDADAEECERGGYRVVYHTTVQQHFFNCPYQLTRMPDVDCSYEEILRRTVASADVGFHEVQGGDIVILGSDGLFDNVFVDELIDVVNALCWSTSSHGVPPTIEPLVLADRLLQMALAAAEGESLTAAGGNEGSARRSRRETPFSKAAFAELGRDVDCGKPDDTTVVVGYVVDPAQHQQQPHKSAAVMTSIKRNGKASEPEATTLTYANSWSIRTPFESQLEAENCRNSLETPHVTNAATYIVPQKPTVTDRIDHKSSSTPTAQARNHRILKAILHDSTRSEISVEQLKKPLVFTDDKPIVCEPTKQNMQSIVLSNNTAYVRRDYYADALRKTNFSWKQQRMAYELEKKSPELSRVPQAVWRLKSQLLCKLGKSGKLDGQLVQTSEDRRSAASLFFQQAALCEQIGNKSLFHSAFVPLPVEPSLGSLLTASRGSFPPARRRLFSGLTAKASHHNGVQHYNHHFSAAAIAAAIGAGTSPACVAAVHM